MRWWLRLRCNEVNRYGLAQPLRPITERLPLIAGLDQLADQRGSGSEAYAVAALAGGQTKRRSDVGFSCAAVAGQQYVLTADEELASRELQSLFQRWNSQEVEAVDALDDWELRLPDAAFVSPAFAERLDPVPGSSVQATPGSAVNRRPPSRVHSCADAGR
jgi:hypothetical protein